MSLARQRPDYSDEDLARLIDVYRNHEPSIALFEDASAALARSARYGPLGLITDGTHWVQKSKVEALGIAGHFKHIVYTGALGGRDFHKPHPRAFELMEAELAAPDALFVYIGDNPAKDFVAPNARGWGTVQVVRPNGIHDARAEVEGGTPQHAIESLDELEHVLEMFSQRA
jgi:putative hydrolase of the HAD superfamily